MTILSEAVDYWCNAFTPDRLPVWQRAIDNQGLSLKVFRDGDEFCAPAEMVARLDASGFATVILTVAGSHAGAVLPEQPDGTPGTDNFDLVAVRPDEMAALAEAHPGRFVGQWSVDPSSGADGIAEAAQMVVEPWCVALHNHTHSWDRPFDHVDFEPFYELAEQHDLPFVMQAGQSGGRFPSDCGRPESIAGPATAHPGVRFVLSHTGWPWTTETIAITAEYPNVYIGTASWPLRHWPDELHEFARGAGRSKVLFATGFPTTGHAQAARQFADTELADKLGSEVIHAITSANARTVFARLQQEH